MRYATYAELDAWLSDPAPAQAESERLLDRASELVDEQIRFAVYATNNAGDPTEATVLAALRDAVCAQVEHWLEVGEDTDIDADVQPRSISLGPMKVDWGSNDGSGAVHEAPLAPRTRRILNRAGLLTVVVNTEPVMWW